MSGGILIVDDSAFTRRTIRTFLAERGFQVCGEAVDGSDAFEKAKELKPALVLLDLAMPELNGIEVAKILRTQLSDLRIVLFTMYNEVLDAEWLASAVGIDAVVAKPDVIDALEPCLRRLLDGSDQPYSGQRT